MKEKELALKIDNLSIDDAKKLILSEDLDIKNIRNIIFNMIRNESENKEMVSFLLDEIEGKSNKIKGHAGHDELYEVMLYLTGVDYNKSYLDIVGVILSRCENKEILDDLLIQFCKNGIEKGVDFVLKQEKKVNLDRKMGIIGAIISKNKNIIYKVFEDNEETIDYVKEWITRNNFSDMHDGVKWFFHRCEMMDSKKLMTEKIKKNNKNKKKAFIIK